MGLESTCGQRMRESPSSFETKSRRQAEPWSQIGGKHLRSSYERLDLEKLAAGMSRQAHWISPLNQPSPLGLGPFQTCPMFRTIPLELLDRFSRKAITSKVNPMWWIPGCGQQGLRLLACFLSWPGLGGLRTWPSRAGGGQPTPHPTLLRDLCPSPPASASASIRV